jgi:hypothetical protein
MAFEDTQAASFLLRISFSAVRATHFMRTTPLTHWRSIATTFDSNIRRAFETIVGFLFPPLPTLKLLSPLGSGASEFVRWPSTLTGPSQPVVLRFFRPGVPNWAGPLRPTPVPPNKRPLFLWTPLFSLQ